MAEDEPKSAYELAMERLQKKDAEEGVEHRPLSDAQKAAIAEVRSQYEAKLADIEIRHEPVAMAAAGGPGRRGRTGQAVPGGAAAAQRGAGEEDTEDP